MVKQDSCRINYTESFLYTVSCNVDIVECIIVIGKGIPPNKPANFCLFQFFFALITHRVPIQASVDVLLNPCLYFILIVIHLYLFRRNHRTKKYGRYHTGKCIRRFAGIYVYCRYFIDWKW